MLIIGYTRKNKENKSFNVQCDCSYKKNNWLFKVLKGKMQCQGCYKEYPFKEFDKAIDECRLIQKDYIKTLCKTKQ